MKSTATIMCCVLLAGCSQAATSEAISSSKAASPTQSSSNETARTAAERIRSQVETVITLTDLTEKTDQNELLGRPNGFSASTVLTDRGGECASDGPGVDCGAAIEQWPDEAAAQKRADYIQTVLKESPVLGSEWDTVRGGLLLRVSGKLPPSKAKKYAAAFAQ